MSDATTAPMVGLAMLLFGATILVALRVFQGSFVSKRNDALCDGMRIVGWTLLVYGASLVMFSAFGGFGLLLWPIGLYAILDALARQRRSQQYALLGLVSACADRFIPLPPALTALARECRGRYPRRVVRLAKALEQGTPLGAAFHEQRQLLPPEARPLLHLGCQTGALVAALRRAVSLRSFHEDNLRSLTGKMFYVFALPFVGACVLTFFMWKIMPQFQHIFGDFEMPLPPRTQIVIDASELVAPLLILLLIPAGFMFLYVLGRSLGLYHWDLPGFGWITWRLQIALVLDGLAVAVEHRVPLAQAFGSLAFDFPKATVRRRLRRVAEGVAAGVDWREAMMDVNLLEEGDRSILAAAERAGNLPWAMSELADSIRRRFTHRYTLVLQTAFFGAVLSFGVLVSLFVTGVFLPLIALIQKLT